MAFENFVTGEDFMTGTDPVIALQAALAAEHAAIYGYGVAGARLHGGPQRTTRTIWEAHQAKRDQLAALITARQAGPVAAAPAYRLPVQPTSDRAAAQLVATFEERLATAYLGLVGVDDTKLRTLGATSMQEAVTRAVRWRNGPPRSAFPGMGPSALTPLPE